MSSHRELVLICLVPLSDFSTQADSTNKMGRQQTPQDDSKKRGIEEEEMREEHILRHTSEVPLPPIPDTNYASFLLSVMANHGGKKALVDSSTGKYHTYSDICAIVPRVCGNLAAAGVGAGDAVLLLSPNHIDFPIASLAIQLLPATCVPVNPTFSPEEVANVLRVSGARWAVVEESVLGVVEQVTTLLLPNTLRQVWVIGSSPSHPSFSGLMRTESQDVPPLQGEDPSFDSARAVALMPFSSGTTGLPKGVLLSHRSLLTTYMQIKLGSIKTGADVLMSKALLALPLFHIYGNLVFIATSTVGGCLVLMAKFSFRGFLEAIQRYKITYTPLVPHIANYLVHSPLLKDYDISSLKLVRCGSAPLSPSTLQAFTKKTGRGIGEGYGLTETCAPVTSNSTRTGFRSGSVGRLLPYMELKIVAPGGTKGLPPGEEGEVWVRHPGLMLGYVLAPGAPPSGLKEGGWLPTGDLGYYDQDGFVFLTDRVKDVIKVKGFQVSSNEVEEVLREADGVADVAVVGVPTPRLGEAPRAYVVPFPGLPTPSPQALKDYVAARLAPHKHLAGGVQVVDALPRNALGKVLKKRLRDDYLYTYAAASSSKL